MSQFDEILRQLRVQAVEGRNASQIVAWLYEELGDDVTMFAVMHRLFLAFKIPVSALRNVEEWSGFGRGGSLSNEELNQLLDPFLARAFLTDN